MSFFKKIPLFFFKVVLLLFSSFFPKENKKKITALEKKTEFFQLNDSDGEDWKLWSVILLVRQTKEKYRCLWELQKPIALYYGFDL